MVESHKRTRARFVCVCVQSLMPSDENKGRVIRFNRFISLTFKPLLWLNFLFFPLPLVVPAPICIFFIYLKIYNGNPLFFININIYYTTYYFAYFCAVKLLKLHRYGETF